MSSKGKPKVEPEPVLVLRCSGCKDHIGSQYGLEIDDDWMEVAWATHLGDTHPEAA